MKIKKFRLKNLVTSFLNIMESSKSVQISLSFSCFAVLLNFSQNLSYYFKLRFFEFQDSKLIFFKNIIFYSNFTNVLYYLKSPILTLAIFFAVQVLIYYFILYLFFIAIIRKLQLHNILNSKYVLFLNYFFQYFVSLFYWTLFVPILELFSNMLDCNWYSYLDDFHTSCSDRNSYINVLSFIAIIVTMISGFFLLWLYRAYIFIDKGLLKKKFTLILAVLYTSKFFLVIIYPVVDENMSVIVFLLLHVIGLYSLYDFVRNFPITNTVLSQCYISVLTSYELLCLIFTIFEYTDWIEEPSLFYVIVILLLFSIKIGLKLFETVYHSLLNSNMENPQFIGYCLEELHRMYHSRHSCNKDSFFLGGVLKLHVKKCTDEKCVMKEKIFNEFDMLDLELQEKIMNNFISQAFIKNIRMINKKDSNVRNFEIIILKFSSFLNKNNASPLRAYYDIQKVYSLNQHKTFYFQSISLNVLTDIRSLIMLYESKWHKSSDLDNEKELEVKTFFEMFNEKLFLKKIFLKLLEKRMNFWDKYKDGFHSYEEVFRFLNSFLNEVVEVREILELKLLKNKNMQKIIFDLKFKTILDCIIFNNVNNAVKNEDELDKIKKKELTLEKNILNCNSFFNGNYTTLQSSFLNSQGRILEVSKKESLARFFNYTMEEVKSLNEIESLMPTFIADIHHRFVSYYLKKDRNSSTKEDRYIGTYGIDKKGFIFPIKLYVGFNFDYSYDMVFQAAFLDIGKRDECLLIFDEKGQVLGLTKEFYKLFCRDLNNLKLDLFILLNIFNFIPNLNSMITKHKLMEDKTNTSLLNQVSQIYFPVNFEEIMMIFALKVKEESEHKTSNKSYGKSVISMKSNKTAKSIKSIQSSNSNRKSNTNKSKSTKFFNKFLQTWNRTIEEKQEIERRFQDKEISNYELLEILIDRPSCKRHKINFNLNVLRNYYSKTECITFCQININKISKDLKEISTSRNKFNTFYDPKTVSYQLNSEVSERFNELELEPITKEEDDIKSNFIVMPTNNEIYFKETPGENNRMMITENDMSFKEAPGENLRMMTTENDVLPSIKEEKIGNNELKVRLTEPLRKMSNKISKNEFNQKIEEKDKKNCIKTPPPESFINSSDHSEILKQNNIEFGKNTSNIKIIDVFDHSSQKSSLSNVKKTFTVFAIINLIQRSLPSCLFSFTLSQLLELIIIICYCISVYILSVQYIDSYYNPLNEAVLNFAKMYNTYSCTNLVTVEYEYAIYNFTDYDNGFLYDTEFKTIILEAFNVLKELQNVERSKPSNFGYQDFFKTVMINSSSISLPIMKEIIFVDFLDSIIKQLYELDITDYKDMTLEKLEYFSINYVKFLEIYHTISQSIDNEFFQTNQTISTGLEIIMLLFVLLIFLLKCFEYCQLDIYYKKLIRILNIFLRVNQKEAFEEFSLSKDIHHVVNDPMDVFLEYNYIDKVLMKRENKIFDPYDSADANTNKKTNRDKKNITKKKFSFQELKPLSKFPLMSFICFFGMLVLLYISLNYYYFVIINEEIKNLINITLFFERIYTLPTTVLMINRLALREKVISNQLFNFPDKRIREIEINAILESYVNELKSTTEYISKYSLNAIDNIQETDFPFLIYGDACESLIMNKLITNDEKEKCQSSLNTAFQKGLLSIINEVLRGITDDEEFRVIFEKTSDIQTQTDGILKRLKANVGVDRVTADYFLNKVLMVFYNELEHFYKGEMLRKIENLKVVILATTIILCLVFIGEIYYSKKYFEKIHRNTSLSLNLIPYDKLLNDEQTLFLIKRYWRE